MYLTIKRAKNTNDKYKKLKDLKASLIFNINIRKLSEPL